MSKNTALITGASDGIGRELARVMAREGWRLILVARRKERLDALAAELASGDVRVIVCDLSMENAAQTLVADLGDEANRVDALVNNAGLGLHDIFWESELHSLRSMMRVNMEALTELSRLIIPSMIARGHGYIVNIASVASFQPGPLMAVYYATKAYVLSFTEALAVELRGTGVSTTAICPGPTKSGFQAVAGTDKAPGMSGTRIPDSLVVAEFTYRMMLRRKTVAVHGVLFRMLVFVERFLPRGLVARLVGRFQSVRST
ncbi:MAG: SDR family oxidoreductase [Spirochaetaceae bacterium]|nr:MAG: SDR family oxidoreductase [Spirochaetaceae bacterium]